MTFSFRYHKIECLLAKPKKDAYLLDLYLPAPLLGHSVEFKEFPPCGDLSNFLNYCLSPAVEGFSVLSGVP